MRDAGDPIGLHEAIGTQIRAMRERANLRQEELADAARRIGLRWTRATVAGIESGRRRLSLEEALLLPLALERANVYALGPGLRRPNLRDLLPSDETWLTVGHSRVNSNFLADTAFGHRTAPPVPLQRVRFREHPAVLADAKRAWKRIWHDADFDKDVMALAEVDALGEAEEKAASKLGVTATLVALAARKLWGRSLTQERDRRVAENGTQRSAATLQAIRGHVTRALLEEIEPILAKR
jgi:transcriptional regulator with XRE-family HTH domain